MNVKQLTKDEKTILIFALRYALPRKTYALSLVVDNLLSNIEQFENWEIESIITDCEYQYCLLYSTIDRTNEFMDNQLYEISSLIINLKTIVTERKKERNY